MSAGKPRPANGFNGRVLPDMIVTGAFTETNFFVSCLRRGDIGCGEGRLTRDLKELGHRVVAIDSSRSMVEASRELDPSTDVRLADATALPLDDA
jgi:2-polyprenyl-3-methyl-5-hydroxy-6-metoxy-1,4-benzoquinol methylase